MRQLQSYVHYRDRDGWYYGPKKQFEGRHRDLKKWVDGMVRYAESEGAKMPEGDKKMNATWECEFEKSCATCAAGPWQTGQPPKNRWILGIYNSVPRCVKYAADRIYHTSGGSFFTSPPKIWAEIDLPEGDKE